MLAVPEPLPDDPEAVVTALETAEIFGKQGDLKEAVRWVRRAAEIASDEGSDMRALTLARAVADLNISSSEPPKQPPADAERQAPPPPPLPGAASAPPAASAAGAEPEAKDPLSSTLPGTPSAMPSALQQAAAAAPAPAAAAATSVVDDPDDDAETRVVDSAKMMAELAAEEPPPPPPATPTNGAGAAEHGADAGAASREADEPTPISRGGIGSIAELLARKEAELPSSQGHAPEAAPADDGWEAPEPPPPPPPPVERRSARPLGERVATPLMPSHPHVDRPRLDAPIHQAVRASIVATAEPGVYVLRVLTAAQAPAPTAQEVFVVVADPTQTPFGSK